VTAVKIAKFLGTAPKNATEHLANTAAAVARNCKLYSGDLIPFPAPKVFASSGRTGVVKTLYGLRSPIDNTLKWLTWPDVVDVVTPATDELDDQRFYYTGDGKPKVSTYALAVSGSGPYPVAAYDLGLPLPTQKPTATATAFTTASTVSVTRDAGNNVTIKTAAAHNIKSGAYISVSGFSFFTGTYARDGAGVITCTITGHGLVSGASVLLIFTSGTATSNRYTVTVTGANTFTCQDTVAGATSGSVNWDVRDLNTSTEATVVDSTTLTYFSTGVAFGTVAAPLANTAGRINLGGQIQARTYLYTWYTPWEEESVGSDPSDPLFLQEGQISTVSSLPTAPPSGNNFIRGIRLYRTQAGTTTDADYLRLATLWFPNTVQTVARASNVATMTLVYPHNMIVGDRFKITGTTPATFDITDGVVASVVDDHTFTYAQTGDTVASVASGGTLYYDVSENPPSSTARYWGDGSFSFTDDFSFRSLLNTLSTTEYVPPPEGLAGLTIIQNNILAGFVGNDLYFSEPGLFHAWPVAYKRTFDTTIVGLAQVGGRLLVLTEGYPYVVEGSNPAIMSVARLSARYPCLSRRSIVETSFGVVYSTHDGLAVYSPASAAQLLTKAIHSSDTWTESLDPSSIVAVLHKEGYFASHTSASLMFEAGDRDTPAFFIDLDFTFSAAWHDKETGSLYTVTGTAGDVYQWDVTGQPSMSMRWKSKTFVLPEPVNMGAARVVADYGAFLGSPIWENIDVDWEDLDVLWDQVDSLVFRLYADKNLVFTTTCSNSNLFRLPAGFKTDTYEIEVEGAIRVRAIHIAETASALRKV
jgi:hypothetical protein